MSIPDHILDFAVEIINDDHGGKLTPDALADMRDAVADQFEGETVDHAALVTALRARLAPAPAAPRSGGRGGRPPQRPAQNRERQPLDPALVSAPYRFVELAEKVVPASDDAKDARLDIPLPEGFCGTVTVEWRFETPMLIGQGSDVSGPTRLVDEPVIPGSTLRGLMRAAVETVSHGRLSQTNAHHRYGVRDFEHPLFADENRPLWDRIGSAWLRRAGDVDPAKAEGDSDWVLDPCEKRMIRIRDLPHDLNSGTDTANGYWHKAWLGKELRERYDTAGMVSGGIIDFSGKRGFSAGARDAEVTPGGGFDGVLVFAGKSPTLRNIAPDELDAQDRNPGKGDQKKREYVFGASPTGAPVRLRQEVWERFQLMNSKPARNRMQPDGSWKVLEPTLKGGGRIPVFFIGDIAEQDEGFDIGLTRLFKRGHRHAVADALRRAGHGEPAPQTPPDVAEALFGYVFEDREAEDNPARKGRVAFGFARLSPDTPAKESALVETVMMGPRASYAPFYLSGKVLDWSDPDARPAGRKRYLRRAGESGEAIYDRLRRWRGNDNSDLVSKLKFLEPEKAGGELAFEGNIRLHNVTAGEIGALLFALTHGGDSAKPFRHMIGRAKPAGAGQARVAALHLDLTANAEAGAALLSEPADWERPGEGREGWLRGKSRSMAPFLRAFEKEMQQHVSTWPRTDSVRQLLGIATPRDWPDSESGYMPLQQFRLVKDKVKAKSKDRPATANPDRLLAAPAVGEVARPYAED